MQKLVKALPLSALVLETDSPALAAEANTRNEPAHLSLALQWLARLKGVDEATAAEAVRVNQRRLFPRLL